MNMSLSQYTRVATSFFFILLFSGTAQASVLEKMIRRLPDVPQSKIEEVFDILESLKISRNIPKNEVRTLALALDDPTYLIKLSPDGVFRSFVHAVFFFSRFDLYKDSDAIFTKLFTKKNGNELKELPFVETKKNWENFLLGAKNSANWSGYNRFTKTDLEAAAISFLQGSSDTYFLYGFPPSRQSPRSLDAYLLVSFFENKFNINHYMSPHFTLTPHNPYYPTIMSRISFIFAGSSYFDLLNSKDFILKIWKDVTQEISRQESPMRASNILLNSISDSIIRSSLLDSSLGNQPFMKALEEAARENDDLAQLVDIVNKLASGRNLQNYRQRLLQQFREIVESQ